MALGRLEWPKDTPRWVTTNTTLKKGLKGRLVVVVAAVVAMTAPTFNAGLK